MKTINKEDVITTTIGDLFTACYDAEIAKGSTHVEAHSIADGIVAKLAKGKVKEEYNALEKELCENYSDEKHTRLCELSEKIWPDGEKARGAN